jgi:hypothetical protein
MQDTFFLGGVVAMHNDVIETSNHMGEILDAGLMVGRGFP